MAKIRELNLFDKIKIKKLMSSEFNDTSNYDTNDIPNYFISFLHRFLPIKLKFLPETYICKKDNEIKCLISLKPASGNSKKWKITKLFLAKNSLEYGKQLIEFVITKYAAKNANTFLVSVEDSNEELLELFSKGCGFRFCTKKQLWEAEKVTVTQETDKSIFFRPFKNSDSQDVMEIYNNCIYSHFRYSLAKNKYEFYDKFFLGLEKNTTFKFVLENSYTKQIIAYFSIKSQDNKNFILNITNDFGCNYFQNIVNFAVKQILKRQKNFKLYVVNKKFNQNNQQLEDYLKENNFKLIQSNAIMVRDYFKTIKDDNLIQSSVMVLNTLNKTAF